MRSIEEYPFVKVVASPWRESLEAHKTDPSVQISPIWYVYEICGERYERHEKDHYIDDAIVIAGYWPAAHVSYQRITWLRAWLRENSEHHHQQSTKGIVTLNQCENLINKLIDLECESLTGFNLDKANKELKTLNTKIWKTL